MNEVLRQEKKFLIDKLTMAKLADELRQVMIEDPHNRGVGYPIRSLYFDSLDDRDAQEKEDGVELRRKIRLRCYSPDADFAMLEMKQKEGPMQRKRSVRLSRDAAMELIHGNRSVLLRQPEPFARECYALMAMHCYMPRAVVEYRRMAFIAKENRIRITFDHDIIATEANYNIFDPMLLQYPVMPESLAVLEVKYNGFLLGYIKDLLRPCNSSELSVSKYMLSRGISKHISF